MTSTWGERKMQIVPKKSKGTPLARWDDKIQFKTDGTNIFYLFGNDLGWIPPA
jgi:hypothetical protein